MNVGVVTKEKEQIIFHTCGDGGFVFLCLANVNVSIICPPVKEGSMKGCGISEILKGRVCLGPAENKCQERST